MENLQNLHTHTIYCDGQDTPEDIIIEAISKGFSSVGFSGHSYVPFARSYSMSEAGTEEYKRSIGELKQKYNGKIDVFCGIEFDNFSNTPLCGYDYVIGSVHYFNIGGEYVGFDRNAANVKSVINDYFGGSSLEFAKAYFELVATLPSCGNIDIVGHFDLAAKHSDIIGFIDINSPRYLSYAYDAIDALQGKIPFFEINTGAMARGFRKTPYPSESLIKRFLECGIKPIITSDCHSKGMLDFGFDTAAELLKYCGARERFVLTDSGFRGVSL